MSCGLHVASPYQKKTVVAICHLSPGELSRKLIPLSQKEEFTEVKMKRQGKNNSIRNFKNLNSAFLFQVTFDTRNHERKEYCHTSSWVKWSSLVVQNRGMKSLLLTDRSVWNHIRIWRCAGCDSTYRTHFTTNISVWSGSSNYTRLRLFETKQKLVW